MPPSSLEMLARALKVRKPTPAGASVPLGLRKKNSTIVLGEVKYIDVERQTFTANVFYRNDTIQEIPISQPFAGPSSHISGMPEVGSIVMLGVMEDFTFLIGYVPAYLFTSNPKQYKLWPRDIGVKENNRYYIHRKLRPGEIDIRSSTGSELFLSEDAVLEDPAGDSLLIRNSDNSIIQTSLSNFEFSGGVWKSSGIIHRPEIDDVGDQDVAHRRTLTDGRITYELKPEDDNAMSQFYSEYLIEAQDLSNAVLPMNSVNESFDSDVRKPVGIFSLGNFVGNNPNKPRTYGKILGVKLFNSSNDREGGFEFKSLIASEPERFGMAAMLYAPKRQNYEYGALFGIDKEGHFYQFIPSATGGGMGAGRSMSILAKGSKKEVWGADSDGTAWDLDLKGGLKWRVGISNQTGGRSIHIVTDGPAYYQYGPASEALRDFDKPDKVIQSTASYKKIEKIAGKERRELKGTSEEIIGGSQKINISGMKTEIIGGSAGRYIGGDYNVQVGSSYNVKASGECQEGFKEKSVTCTSGGHSLLVYTNGDITETINVRGSRTTDILGSGNIKETILTRGSRSFKTSSGSFDVQSTVQGNIRMRTTAGSIVHKTKAGKAEINATLQVIVKTKASMEVKGAKIKLKTATPTSGCITKLSHLDYITGAPLQNSKTVSIST